MLILVILTIAATVESYDTKQQSVSSGELLPDSERLEGGHRKYLPLWPNKKLISMSPVGRKILNMTNALGDLLKEDQQKLENVNFIRAKMKVGMKELDQLDRRCRYREKIVRESIDKNLGLLDKLRCFVKEKEKFDNQLHQDLNGIYKDFKQQPDEKIQKSLKKASSSLLLLMPDHLINNQLKLN